MHALGGDALDLVAAHRRTNANFPARGLEPLDVIVEPKKDAAGR
jgi:hypothetical protein